MLDRLTGLPVERGRATRRQVLGDVHVDRSAAGATPLLNAPFVDLITGCAWGEIWTRPGLDRVTRSCITLAMLTALGRFEELPLHVRGAVRNGLTHEQIAEVLLQAAVYCGVPAANSAFAVAQRTLDELAAEAGDGADLHRLGCLPDRARRTPMAPISQLAGAPCWIDLTEQADIERSKAVYGELFGWAFEDTGADFGHYNMASKDGAAVGGVMAKQDLSVPDTWTVYLHTTDISATAQKVTAAGGQLMFPPMAVDRHPRVDDGDHRPGGRRRRCVAARRLRRLRPHRYARHAALVSSRSRRATTRPWRCTGTPSTGTSTR